jgi:chaperonin GroES
VWWAWAPTCAQSRWTRALFDPEEKAEVEVQGETYVVLRERDIHAVAAARLGDSPTGLYL